MQHAPLVNAGKVCLLLYIMLELDKNFVKAMHHQGEGFEHIGELFSYKTEAKIKHGIFVRPEIRKVLKDKDFQTKLGSNELDAWNAFCVGGPKLPRKAQGNQLHRKC